MGQAWDWTAWIWWAAALLLGAGGLWLAYRSLLADRSRGRRRCRKCWYIMDGLDSLRCPECGWEAKRVRQLHRTRRRWRWFAVSVILLIGAYACYLTPKGQRNGWETVMPTSVLVFIAPIDKYQVGWQPGNGLSPPPAPTDPFGIELRERVARGSLYAWQWQVMLDRWFDAHPEEKKGLIGIRRQWPEGVPIRARGRAHRERSLPHPAEFAKRALGRFQSLDL